MGDKFTIRVVVAGLAAIAVGALVFMGLLALRDKAIPTEIVSVSSAAIGALAAMLARTSYDEPQSTTTTTTSNVEAAPAAVASGRWVDGKWVTG